MLQLMHTENIPVLPQDADPPEADCLPLLSLSIKLVCVLIHLASGGTIQLHLRVFFSSSCHWQPQSEQCQQLRLFVRDFSRREGKC
jgi:hypothetical protein